MIELTEKEKQYIINHKDLIILKKYDEFFGNSSTTMTQTLTQFIYFDAKVNFLPYIAAIYPYMFAFTDLTKITIPGNIEEIGRCAFSGCIELEDVLLFEGLESIGPHAFDGCKSLEKIIIPKTLTGIGEYAFGECEQLQHVKMPEKFKDVDLSRVFLRCSPNLEIEYY